MGSTCAFRRKPVTVATVEYMHPTVPEIVEHCQAINFRVLSPLPADELKSIDPGNRNVRLRRHYITFGLNTHQRFVILRTVAANIVWSLGRPTPSLVWGDVQLACLNSEQQVWAIRYWVWDSG